MRISCSCERVAGLDGKPCVRQGPLDPSRLDKPLISLIDANDEPKERRDGRRSSPKGGQSGFAEWILSRPATLSEISVNTRFDCIHCIVQYSLAYEHPA